MALTNKVEDGRLLRAGGRPTPHVPWSDRQDEHDGFLGAGIEGTGFEVYMLCHEWTGKRFAGGVRIDVVIEDETWPLIFRSKLKAYPWYEEDIEAVVKLFHDVLERLLPAKLMDVGNIMDGIYLELRHRLENELEPFTPQ